MAIEDRWIGMKELCKYLGASRQSILAWIQTKNLPAAKVGKFWRFKQEDIDRWMRDNYTRHKE